MGFEFLPRQLDRFEHAGAFISRPFAYPLGVMELL